MPVWTADELYKLWQSQYSAFNEQDWKERFYTWGGVPRSIFTKTDNVYQRFLHDDIDRLNIDACLQSIGLTGCETKTSSASGTVLHLTVTEDGDYEDFKVLFASLYVEAQVFKRYERSKWQELTNFIQESQHDQGYLSARGYIFEALAHRQLTRGGKFHVCPPFL